MKASTRLPAARMRSATPSPYLTGITPWRQPAVVPVAGQADHRRPGSPANCTASEPTPPAAPDTTTVSPGVKFTARTAA